MTLGERLKAVRGRGTQKQLAADLKVTTNTYAAYERDERIPDAHFLEAICRKFQINPAWLLLGEGSAMQAAQAGTFEQKDADLLSQCIETAYVIVTHKESSPEMLAFLLRLWKTTINLYEIYDVASVAASSAKDESEILVALGTAAKSMEGEATEAIKDFLRSAASGRPGPEAEE